MVTRDSSSFLSYKWSASSGWEMDAVMHVEVNHLQRSDWFTGPLWLKYCSSGLVNGHKHISSSSSLINKKKTLTDWTLFQFALDSSTLRLLWHQYQREREGELTRERERLRGRKIWFDKRKWSQSFQHDANLFIFSFIRICMVSFRQRASYSIC